MTRVRSVEESTAKCASAVGSSGSCGPVLSTPIVTVRLICPAPAAGFAIPLFGPERRFVRQTP
ncbi:hypothetical protein GCM10027087_45900 [Paractinoplanes abujensis]